MSRPTETQTAGGYPVCLAVDDDWYHHRLVPDSDLTVCGRTATTILWTTWADTAIVRRCLDCRRAGW